MKGTLLNSRWAPGNSNYYDTCDYDNGYNTNSTFTQQSSRRSKPPPPRTHSVPASRAPQSTSYSHWTSHSHAHSHPPSQTQSQSSSTLLPPAEELARFMKIVSRLRWKLPFLAEAYRLATTTANPSTSLSSEAEIMFKIDFFEYYALLERAIVHLLAVFNITVTSSSSSARGRAQNTNGGVSYSNGTTLHRYHANVLAALESESSPLTPVLGSGHVFEQLRLAKELRNRWKTADMTREQVARDPIGDRDRDRDADGVRPLESYDLEGILSAIFAGLEEGFVRAREHVALCRRVGGDEEGGGDGGGREEGWEFMVDAMDWEAV